MRSSTTNSVFFTHILLASIVNSVVSSCTYSEITCYQSLTTWCCPYVDTCGSTPYSCRDSSSLPPTIIAIIIVASIFCFVICLSCCIQSHQRQQRLRTTMTNANTQVNRNPHQQRVLQGPVRVVHVRPVSYVGAASPSRSFPSIYEAPPPSYEVAVATPPPMYQSSLTPPIAAITITEQSDSSVL